MPNIVCIHVRPLCHLHSTRKYVHRLSNVYLIVLKMTIKKVARGNKRTRRGRREMSERFLSIDRTFDSPPTELNDGGGREGTAIEIDVK
jgi:hypothetical protein